jgi:membrane protease YdiL (CAAX protease family)
MNSTQISARRWSWLFPIEVGLFALIFWADKAGLVPLSKTPFLFVVAWASLAVRRQSWRSSGLRWGTAGASMTALGIAAGVVFWIFEYFVDNPLFHAWLGVLPDLSTFKGLVGNLPGLLLILLLNLILAGFGEEMVWRGYAISRVAELLDAGRAAAVISILAVNLAFGLAHAYQGEAGVAQSAVQGALLGALYIGTGRNLVAPIVAHVTANTCDFALIFLGIHVGLTAAPG